MNNSLQNSQLSPMNVILYGHTLMGNMLLFKDMPPIAAMYTPKAFNLRYNMCLFFRQKLIELYEILFLHQQILRMLQAFHICTTVYAR